MRERHSKLYLGLGLMFLMSLFFVGFNNTTVEAVPSRDQVYQGAPSGMDLEDFFSWPSSYNYGSTVQNSVQIIGKGSSGATTDIVQMTNGSNDVGSIWGRMSSNNEDYNYFDITKKQTFSMWVYMGDKRFNYTKYNEDKNDIDGNNGSGEGIAFVIQNDDNDENAIAHYDGLFGLNDTPSGKESLGVWGGSPFVGANSLSDTKNFAKGAIQNSFAMELDTRRNVRAAQNFQLQDDYFDATMGSDNTKEAKGQHIAWNYPGESSTYNVGITDPLWTSHTMEHKGVIHNLNMTGDATVESAWHHFTFTYYPPEDNKSAHIFYAFSDKDYDGTIRPFNNWDSRGEGTVKHPIMDIDIGKLNLDPGQTKVRWGLTSASGDTATTNAVIFESIPAVADIETTTNLYDYTQERDIPDSDRNSTVDDDVNNGDKLRFDYNLTYNSGLMSTGDITTKINVPKNVDFTADEAGNIGEIKYSGETVKINASQLNSDGTIDLTLNSMGKDNVSAQIRLYGTANIGSDGNINPVLVKQAHTSYDSDHYTGDVMTPQFTINPLGDTLQLAPKDTDDTMQRSIITGKEAQMDMNINYQNGSSFGNDKVTVTTIVDKGTDKETKSSSIQAVDSSATNSEYSLVMSGLKAGDHNVEVYVTDSKHRISNYLNYLVKAEDRKLLFEVDNEREMTISLDDTIDLTGVLKYNDGSEFDLNDMSIIWKTDDKTPLNVVPKAPNYNDPTIGQSEYKYTFSVSGEVLGIGDHKVVVYASGGGGINYSDKIEFTIHVVDKVLQLTSDKNYRFQTTNQSNESKVIKRDGTWTLNVTSAKTPWILTVRSDGLMGSNGIPITGSMVYRDDANEYTLANDPVEIARDETSDIIEDTEYIGENWKPLEGILLKVAPNTSAGTYTGEIQWTLVDGPMQ
ncbi:hypothetical protein [Companilactobacillus nodensis]|uniref:hypothetical protein n=2 Tax=Companilactobacillus nodensis TaxID=460870 RepID=UPI00046ABE6B|nr:hypothetical protein [Companilactobacillus nodensis]